MHETLDPNIRWLVAAMDGVHGIAVKVRPLMRTSQPAVELVRDTHRSWCRPDRHQGVEHTADLPGTGIAYELPCAADAVVDTDQLNTA